MGQVLGPIGLCPCGSGKPYASCCYGSDGRAIRWTDPNEWPFAAQWPGQLRLIGDQAATSPLPEGRNAAQRVGALLATVLPDLPIPALGNATLRESWQAGGDAREAASMVTEALIAAAHDNVLAVPADELWRNLKAPRQPRWGDEERAFAVSTLLGFQMPVRGLSLDEVGGAQRLWADTVQALQPKIRRPELHAAAVDYATCWMLFRPETQRDLAQIYRVGVSGLSARFVAMRHTLKLVWYDPRYCAQDSSWSEMLERTAHAIADGEDEGDGGHTV